MNSQVSEIELDSNLWLSLPNELIDKILLSIYNWNILLINKYYCKKFYKKYIDTLPGLNDLIKYINIGLLYISSDKVPFESLEAIAGLQFYFEEYLLHIYSDTTIKKIFNLPLWIFNIQTKNHPLNNKYYQYTLLYIKNIVLFPLNEINIIDYNNIKYRNVKNYFFNSFVSIEIDILTKIDNFEYFCKKIYDKNIKFCIPKSQYDLFNNEEVKCRMGYY